MYPDARSQSTLTDPQSRHQDCRTVRDGAARRRPLTDETAIRPIVGQRVGQLSDCQTVGLSAHCRKSVGHCQTQLSALAALKALSDWGCRQGSARRHGSPFGAQDPGPVRSDRAGMAACTPSSFLAMCVCKVSALGWADDNAGMRHGCSRVHGMPRRTRPPHPADLLCTCEKVVLRPRIDTARYRHRHRHRRTLPVAQAGCTCRRARVGIKVHHRLPVPVHECRYRRWYHPV